jgi:hypothetical protein
MEKKYLYIGGIILVILGILIALYIGKEIGEKDQRDQQIKTEIRTIHEDNKKSLLKIDSLNKIIKASIGKDKILKEKETVVRTEYKTITLPQPTNKECNDLYEKATTKIALMEETIVIKDSIESNLRREIRLKDNVIFEKDNIISNKDKEIALMKDLSKPRSKKWAISAHLGTGYGMNTSSTSVQFKQVPVYVGVGVSRNIISF